MQFLPCYSLNVVQGRDTKSVTGVLILSTDAFRKVVICCDCKGICCPPAGGLYTASQDVYGELVAISTIVAVTVASIALIIRMVSRNQRAVDEATGWLKRIVITWIVLNSLGFIVAYLQPLISGGQYTP